MLLRSFLMQVREVLESRGCKIRMNCEVQHISTSNEGKKFRTFIIFFSIDSKLMKRKHGTSNAAGLGQDAL